MLKAGERRKAHPIASAPKKPTGDILQFPKLPEESSAPEEHPDHPDHETVSRWLKLADELLGKEEESRKKA